MHNVGLLVGGAGSGFRVGKCEIWAAMKWGGGIGFSLRAHIYQLVECREWHFCETQIGSSSVAFSVEMTIEVLNLRTFLSEKKNRCVKAS